MSFVLSQTFFLLLPVLQQVTDKETDLLPVAQAEPETFLSESDAIATRDVLRITSSFRGETDSATNPSLDDDDDDDDDDDGDDNNRPAVISVRITKPTVDMALGLSFKVLPGELQIGRIEAGGPLADSPLQGGDRLVSLDNKVMAQCSAFDAAQYIRHKVGTLTVVARTLDGDPGVVEAAVYKQHPSDMLGIAFCNEFGRLRVKGIVENGLLGDSVLVPGDYVETINSIDVSCVDKTVAVRIVREAEKLVTIRARKTFTTTLSVKEITPFSSTQELDSSQLVAAAAEVSMLGEEDAMMSADLSIQPAFVSMKISKDPLSSTLGIALSNPSSKELKITKISERGPVGRFPVRPGCIVLSINGLRSLFWTGKKAREFIEQLDGDIVLVLYIPGGNPAYVQAMATKPTARGALGFTLRTNGDPLHIGTINPSGIFANSVLNEQDAVIAINGIPCQHLSAAEAVQITQRNPELVCVLTKPHPYTGIVLSRLASRASAKIRGQPIAEVLAPAFLVGL